LSCVNTFFLLIPLFPPIQIFGGLIPYGEHRFNNENIDILYRTVQIEKFSLYACLSIIILLVALGYYIYTMIYFSKYDEKVESFSEFFKIKQIKISTILLVSLEVIYSLVIVLFYLFNPIV